jgi:hypothetical protein
VTELELQLDDDPIAIEHVAGLDDVTAQWATERGFLVGLPNVLVVTKVRDVAATIEVFKAAYPPRYVRQNIEPFLARLPLRLELPWPDTALLLDGLRASDVIDYEVNP